ncbi:MAG: DUF1353 domain-containing protein [Rudaea sp.]|nr:DUF1353 domain-containing protein [Rudaea sp.]
MSKFLTDLDVVLLSDSANSDRGAWRLQNELVYQSDAAATVFVVSTGFVTDFASVPRIPGVFDLVGDTAHAAATLHDWLYATHAVPRDVADAVLQEAAKVSGVASFKAWLMWAGVRLGGASHWTK